MWYQWKTAQKKLDIWRTGGWRVFGRAHARFINRKFRKFIPESSGIGDLCLEIGSGGGGVICPIIKEKNLTGIGIDPALESSIKVLKNRVQEEKLPIYSILGLGEYIPLRDSSVRVIIIAATLDHVANYRHVFEECYRVLQKNGYLIVLQTIVREKREDYHSTVHLSEFTINDLSNLCKKYGFKVEKIKLFHGLRPRPLHVLKLIPKLYDFIGRLIYNPYLAVLKAKIRQK